MPREKVIIEQPRISTKRGDSYVMEPYLGDKPLGENQTLITSPMVEVTWGRDDEMVRIGFELNRERWIEIADWLRENPEVHSFVQYTGFIPRKQLLATIRTLRRACAAAFGADE